LKLIEGAEGFVVEVVFSDSIPDVLGWIEFGAVRGLFDEADVFRDVEALGYVPPRLVDKHHDEEFFKILSDLIQKDIHHVRVCVGQDE